ncbi:MAG: HNH endonuclease signature motif containing protein [Clostridia bacterium]
MDSKSLERFLSKVEIDEKTGCWIWTASLLGSYAGFFYEGKKCRAHRLSFEHYKGPIPECLDVCHDCPEGDNPLCVNPEHLWLGTQSENIQDMWDKGRRSIDQILSIKKPAVISFEKVSEIRELYSTGLVTMQDLADHFDITKGTICKIVNKQNRIAA